MRNALRRSLIGAAALLVIVTGVAAGESDANDVTPPRAIVRVAPHYPEAARRKRIQGQVVMTLSISKKGDVQKVEVVKGLPRGGEGLDKAAVDAMLQWKFEPAKKNGEPVDAEFPMTLTFKL